MAIRVEDVDVPRWRPADAVCPYQSDRARIRLLGVVLDPLTMDETVDRVQQLIEEGHCHQHVVVNAGKVVQAAHDPLLASIIEHADVVSADGMAVVWAARALGYDVPERVTGIDLMDRLLELAAERGYSVFFLGARPNVLARAIEVECRRRPALKVAGSHHGYWRPDDEQEVVRQVRESGASLLLIAMSSPQKECFIERHRNDLGIPLMMGVGGSLDVVAGFMTRAPQIFQRLGLEWLYRWSQEPRRMTGRYLVGNSKFILLVLAERRGLRRRRDVVALGRQGP